MTFWYASKMRATTLLRQSVADVKATLGEINLFFKFEISLNTLAGVKRVSLSPACLMAALHAAR